MKSELPGIRIKEAWLLRGAASYWLNELWGKGESLRSDEEYQKIVDVYKKHWNPYEDKVLRAMYKITQLEFRQNTIDVYIAPCFNALSDPMIIGVTYKPDIFIDTLTHELIHRLLTDNTTFPYDSWLLDEWKNLFGKNLAFNTLIHIPVHAVHKAIYLDYLKEPKRYKRDIAEMKRYKAVDYVESWKYVDEHGYKEIIEKLKELYRRLSTTPSA